MGKKIMDNVNDSLSSAYFLGTLKYYTILFGLDLKPTIYSI